MLYYAVIKYKLFQRTLIVLFTSGWSAPNTLFSIQCLTFESICRGIMDIVVLSWKIRETCRLMNSDTMSELWYPCKLKIKLKQKMHVRTTVVSDAAFVILHHQYQYFTINTICLTRSISNFNSSSFPIRMSNWII